jgi:twitching motility protein PilJ
MARRVKSHGRKGRSPQKGFFFKREKGQQTMTTSKFKVLIRKSGGLYAPVGLLVILFVFVAVTFYLITKDSHNEQEWVSLSTDLQVQSQQLAKSASEAVEGSSSAFLDLSDSRSMISSAMTSLKNGNSGKSLPALPTSLSAPLGELDKTWRRMSTNAAKILEREVLVKELAAASSEFMTAIPQIQTLTDNAVRDLTRGGAPTQQVFVAGRQLVLSDRMLRHLKEMLRGGSGSIEAADNFRNEIGSFEQVLNALLRGSNSVGVTQVSDASALNALGQVQKIFAQARPSIDIILNSSSDILAARGAADEIFLDSQNLFRLSRDVSDGILNRSDSRAWPSLWSGSLALVVILAIITLLVRSFLAAERRRAIEAGMQNQKNQQAIMHLLDEMSSLADGDLTVQATVTDNMTGAIADSINFAVEQLRELVTGINITAQTVAESAQGTMDITGKLAAASSQQAEQVREVTDTINDMSESFDIMAERSRESSEVAQKSVAIANKGSNMVQQTIQGMDTIRDQIQETSKRIKRLGESSQEIGDIVELINGIAEQTNILALNAAIQSASAGGAGRGFAVVADEVQRLAERATNATRRIEILVKNIQADTSEAVVSMESTTAEVVSGARKAEDAGEALVQIESVSKNLSRLIEEISTEAQAQSQTATQVAGQMTDIRDISIKTSEGTNQTAQSMGQLADLVSKLSESVADFKLPRQDA